jgi:hypothetical protein
MPNFFNRLQSPGGNFNPPAMQRLVPPPTPAMQGPMMQPQQLPQSPMGNSSGPPSNMPPTMPMNNTGMQPNMMSPSNPLLQRLLQMRAQGMGNQSMIPQPGNPTQSNSNPSLLGQ